MNSSYINRNIAFDLLKSFAIYLVIYGHVVQYMQPGELLDKDPYVYIYAFHMPLFMCITGYFSLSSMGLSFREMIVKKGRQLLLPALCWGGVEILLFLVKWIILDCEIACEKIAFIFLGCLWYLKSAFVCYCLYWLCSRYGRKNVSKLLMVLLTYTFCIFFQLILPTMDYGLIVMYPSFILGVILRTYNIEKLIKSWHIVTMAVVFIVLMIYWDKSYWEIPKLLYGDWSYNALEEYAWKIGYKSVIGFAGAMLFMSIFVRYFGIGIFCDELGNSFASVGRNTLALYCIHATAADLLFSHLLVGNYFSETIFYIVVAPCITAFIIVVIQIATKYIERNQAMSLCFLGK